MMEAFYNKNLDKWWNGETTLERENSESLYGKITATDAINAGYVKMTKPDPVIQAPTEQDNARVRMQEIDAILKSKDYLTSKELDGEDMTEYGDYKAKRKALRAEYRTLEEIANKK